MAAQGPPSGRAKKERKEVFLSDVQHVYLYSLLNSNSKVLLKNLVHKSVKSRHRATERAGKFTIAHCARSPGSGVGYLGGLVLDFPKKFDFDKLNM